MRRARKETRWESENAPHPADQSVGACYLRRVKISIVIPTLNEAQQIRGAIRSARAENVEVLVVDGGSVDGTQAAVERLGVPLYSGVSGRARQLEFGFRQAQGEVCLFLHADTRLPDGWRDAVCNALADPRVAGGAFRFRFDAPRGVSLRLVEWGARLRASLLGLPYGDQAIFVRTTVLDAMGGIPSVCLFEDLDLVRGLRAQGRFVLLPHVVSTSGRRHRSHGVMKTAFRHAVALLGWRLGWNRQRLLAWVRQ